MASLTVVPDDAAVWLWRPACLSVQDVAQAVLCLPRPGDGPKQLQGVPLTLHTSRRGSLSATVEIVKVCVGGDGAYRLRRRAGVLLLTLTAMPVAVWCLYVCMYGSGEDQGQHLREGGTSPPSPASQASVQTEDRSLWS